MATLSLEPQVVDITGHAGDTLTVNIKLPPDTIGGREWSSQVRSTPDAAVDAAWTISAPIPDPEDPLLVVVAVTLTAADTARLQAGGPMTVQRVGARTVTAGKYSGVYDVQLAPPGGGDPTTTVIKGSLTIGPDVTRPS